MSRYVGLVNRMIIPAMASRHDFFCRISKNSVRFEASVTYHQLNELDYPLSPGVNHVQSTIGSDEAEHHSREENRHHRAPLRGRASGHFGRWLLAAYAHHATDHCGPRAGAAKGTG